MAIYNSNPTSPKSESPTYRSEDSSPQKPQREGSRIEAAPPEWATGPGYWYNDGYEVTWITEKPFMDGGPTHYGHGGSPHPYENHPNQWIGPPLDIEEESFPDEDIPTIKHHGENIIIEKKLYGNRSFSRLANRDFSELFQEQKIDTKKFFIEYDKLFYDIPKQGSVNSHNFLIEKSTDYIEDYIDPKDDIIENLETQVQTLEEENELLRNPAEHPFYRNGTVIARGKGSGKFYYMDRGKKRVITGGRPADVWKALKASLGYNESQDDFKDNIVLQVPAAIVDEIPTGPSLGIEDLGSGNIFGAESARENEVRLGADDYKVDPTQWEDVQAYKNHLEGEIEEAWHAEHDIEARYYSYKEDVQYEETSEKRMEAQRLADEFKIKLTQLRNKLVKYKKIYEAIENDTDITISGLDDIYNEFSDEDNITKSMRDEFKGWEKGKFDDRDGKYGAFGEEGGTGGNN